MLVADRLLSSRNQTYYSLFFQSENLFIQCFPVFYKTELASHFSKWIPVMNSYKKINSRSLTDYLVVQLGEPLLKYSILLSNYKFLVKIHQCCVHVWIRHKTKSCNVRLQWNSISSIITDSVLTFIHFLWETLQPESTDYLTVQIHTHRHIYLTPQFLIHTFRCRSSLWMMCHFVNDSFCHLRLAQSLLQERFSFCLFFFTHNENN